MASKGYLVKLRNFALTPFIFLLLSIQVTAREPTDRFKMVVDHMVNAINEQDYPRIQKDFSKTMLEAYPLKKPGPFSRN